MLSGCLFTNTNNNDSISIQKQSPQNVGRRRSRRSRRPIRATQLARTDNARFYALTTTDCLRPCRLPAYFSLKRARTTETTDAKRCRRCHFRTDVRTRRKLSGECPCFARSTADVSRAAPRPDFVEIALAQAEVTNPDNYARPR